MIDENESHLECKHREIICICVGDCEPMCKQCHAMADRAADDRVAEEGFER